MPSNVTRDGDFLVDRNGSPITKISSENDKCFAVIVRCGHCGDGYFIPIMFTARSKDIYTAIESIKTNSRVQRNKKDVVLAAFEITEHEQFFIESINDHDPYLRGLHRKDDDQILDRRVYSDYENYSVSNKERNRRLDDRVIKTADEYRPYYVLERAFAPRQQGDRIVPASRKINKDELFKEYFKCNCIRHSVKKGNPFLLVLYYQQYGKNNELGLEYERGYLHFFSDGKQRTFEVPDEMCKFLDEKIAEEKALEKLQKEQEMAYMNRQVNRPTRVDKFRTRMQKHYNISGMGEKPEEDQGGYSPEY